MVPALLIVDSLSHVVVVAGQGVQKERQHAQLEVCDHVNPQLFNDDNDDDDAQLEVCDVSPQLFIPSLYQPRCLAC